MSLSGRLSSRRPGPAAVARLALVSLVGLILIIPSGALVRLTDSGLGCPDWPGCHGEVIPPLSGHAWIEYTNRVFSAIVVIVAVVAWIAAAALRPANRRLRRAGAIPAIAGIAQGPLGGLTVVFDLHPLLVSSHFLLSIVALAAGAVFAVLAHDHRDGRLRRLQPGRARVAAAAALGLGGVIVTGVLVTASGPHSGDPKVIRRIWELESAAAVHVRVVIVFVVLAVLAAVMLHRARPLERLTRRLAFTFAPLLALQIAIGEYQYRNQLPWEVILVHVTVAGLLWSTGVALAWTMAHPASTPDHVHTGGPTEPQVADVPSVPSHASIT